MSEQVNDDVVDRGGSKKAGRLYQFFASTKLAWYLTLALGLIILIGTIIPQKGITQQPDAAARHIAEDTWWRLADSLGFLEIFHQWYFFVLLGLFYTNLIVGSVDGLSRLERQLEVSGKPLTDELKKRLRNRSVDLPNPVTAEMVAREFEGAVKFQAPTSEGQTSFMFGEKGRLSRFMPYILHFGFIIIGIGGAITAMKGMEGRMFIPEGTSSNKFFVQTRDGEVLNYELPFDVRCDDFRIEFYPGTQQPKDFNSDLAVIDNGQELFRRTIEVNDPLRYKGFRLFQAFYERIGTMARMKVTDTDGQVVLDRLMTKSEVAPLTTTDGFTIVDFVPNHDDKGPALQVRALTNGETQEFWVYRAPILSYLNQNGNYHYEFAGLEDVYATGLQVSLDPGVKITLTGCAIAIPSLLWALFGYHHRVWVRLEPQKLHIAWSAHKKLPELEARLDQVLANLSGTPREDSHG